MSRAALRAARPRTGIAIRIVGLAAAPSHIPEYEATIRPLYPLCAAILPDLVVVATGSGSNHNKVRKASLTTGRKPSLRGIEWECFHRLAVLAHRMVGLNHWTFGNRRDR